MIIIIIIIIIKIMVITIIIITSKTIIKVVNLFYLFGRTVSCFSGKKL